MIRDGLLTRLPSGDDQRSYRVAMTDDGRARYERARPAMRRRQAHLLGALSEDQRSALFDALDALDGAARREDFGA
jgi:DNA-binding MarR family transcriptional regulator